MFQSNRVKSVGLFLLAQQGGFGAKPGHLRQIEGDYVVTGAKT
jgi:hypothetical protein